MSTGQTVLITGGSGLIGRYLTSLLLEKGYSVSHLSRGRGYPGRVRVHTWAPEKGVLDPTVFTGIDHLVHLSGANIGSKRWSKKRKEEIISSRVNSARLIHKTVSENNIRLKTFISASAIGYYGAVTSDRISTEDDPPGNDFLALTCRLWEESADLFKKSGTRTVKIRTGVVIEKNDSLLSRYLAVARFGVFPVIGSGKQCLPWIHISDLCNIYLKAIEDTRMSGVYNAVSDESPCQKSFVKTLATAMKRLPVLLPVPSFLLRLIMGESSVIALRGSRVSCEKLVSEGYNFAYPSLISALDYELK
jgi:uncharacterized protein